MEINKINCFSAIKLANKPNNNSPVVQNLNQKNRAELDVLAFLGKSQINKKYELGLSHEELLKRTNSDYLATKQYLSLNSPEYQNLDLGDKKALVHLVKAAKALDEIFMVQDNHHNLDFRDFLNSEIAKNNEDAKLTKILFDAQKGVCSVDNNTNQIELAKGISETRGKGFYPENLEPEQFQQILIKMLKSGMKDEVSNILNQRSIVEWDDEILKATDYVNVFKNEFDFIAKELELASFYSTNKDFNEYLNLQAKALRTVDPLLDGYADKKWATLQDAPLEFTISRENYDDELTGVVFENEELKALLEKFNITVTPKDSLGGRVGIVNKKGTEDILKVKKFLPLMAQNMPYKDAYAQSFSTAANPKQTMVDVDLVDTTGMAGSWRAGIFLAQNLPNSDKASIKFLDGGRRNVYHRQIRTSLNDDALIKQKNMLNAILEPDLHKYYNPEADHWFTIGHENGHSLGPSEGREALGKYKSIIEENKADMVSLAMLDVLCDAGLYTDEQCKQIIVTFAVDNILKSKPTLSQAHRVRSVMQDYYFLKEGAISISEDGILDVDIEKMVPTAKKMLKEIIKVQMSKDFNKAEKFVLDNFQWDDRLDNAANNLSSVFKTLNGRIETPLADYLYNSSKE